MRVLLVSLVLGVPLQQACFVVEDLARASALPPGGPCRGAREALRVLEEADLRWAFDVVIVSDVTGWRKPRPEIFQATLGALGIAPEEALHVGDNLNADVNGASAVGMKTAWVTRQVEDPNAKLAEHDGSVPDLVVADLAELVIGIDHLTWD